LIDDLLEYMYVEVAQLKTAQKTPGQLSLVTVVAES
jgi:hypothetical protein